MDDSVDHYEGGSPGEEDDEEVDVAVDEVIKRILEAWINEKFAPDILPSKMDLAESLLNGTSDVRDGLQSTTKDDFLACIQEMELDRINFVISSYTRLRLKKIEDLFIYVTGNKKVLPNLSEKEAEYAKEFSKCSKALLNSLVKEMPANIQADNRKNAPQKRPDTYVFFEVVQKLEQVVFESDDEPMDLDIGSRHLMRYGLIVPLLMDGSVKLI